MIERHINIISSNAIDAEKWNACIEQSKSPLIYGYTWYLDHMTDNWSGIIINDYEAVMPVPWRKKYGIAYTYDVPFVQQLGGFTNTVFEDDFFVKTLVDNFKYGDYNFNYNNNYKVLKSRTNYVIDLSFDYDKLKQAYKNDLLNNLAKASAENLTYKNADFAEAITIYQQLYGRRLINVKPGNYKKLEQLCALLIKDNKVIVRKVTDKNEDTLAIALLLTDGRRLYNLANSITVAGRKKAANHFLFDELIKEFAGSGMILDFEGSDIPGVKHFYSNFGGIDQHYYTLHFNRLPAPLRWLKH